MVENKHLTEPPLFNHIAQHRLGSGNGSALPNNYGGEGANDRGSSAGSSPERSSVIANKESIVSNRKPRRFSLQAGAVSASSSSLLNDMGQHRPIAATIASSPPKGAVAKKIASNVSKGVFADPTFQRMRLLFKLLTL